jgi:hypothetical protein
MTSATGVPVSARFKANEICSSVNLLFFTAPLLPPGSHKTGKLAFKPEEKNGKTSQAVWKQREIAVLADSIRGESALES